LQKHIPGQRRCLFLQKRREKILGIGKDEGKAIVKYIRISSSKVKIVLDLIRNKSLDEAYGIVKKYTKSSFGGVI
jgi:large subunit ribosomal protein L22